MNQNCLWHVCVRESAGENIRFEFLCEETLHILVNKLLEELIEEEERLPNIDTYLDRAFDEHSLFVLEVVNNFDMWLATLLHLTSHGLPLGNQLVDQVCDQQFQLGLHRFLSQVSVIDDPFESLDFAIKDIECLLESVNPSAVHVLLASLDILLPSHVLDRVEASLRNEHNPVFERSQRLRSLAT